MLQINNLHANVGDKPILKGLTLSLNAGEIHAIMGPNGAGKSTLGYVLSGRPGYEVTEGSVTFTPPVLPGEGLGGLARPTPDGEQLPVVRGAEPERELRGDGARPQNSPARLFQCLHPCPPFDPVP